MISEFLQERASLYAVGAITAQEREQFELLLEFHEELRVFAVGLLETGMAATVATLPAIHQPSASCRQRILKSVESRAQQTNPDCIVVSGPDGLVEWVNPAFTAMCGYTLEELQGKKPGSVLQGEDTNPATVARMRGALRENRPSRETILNYHKNGTPYWVDISITPILDEEGNLLWAVARERELPDYIAA